ncbi:MAG TPA: AAA family ATPase [Nostocaceae cyanobacterium]|nr:AAA family ATPase [Nostocaceae cyanobacterium]
MYLSKFQLFNYKSFLDSSLLEFTPGINIIVGQNNTGKTALLEALTLNFNNCPHKSIATLPTENSVLKDPDSRAKIYLSLTKNELRELMDKLSPILILASNSDSGDTIQQFQYLLMHNGLIELNLSILCNGIIDIENTPASQFTFNLYSPVQNETIKNQRCIFVNVKPTATDPIKLYQQSSHEIVSWNQLLSLFYVKIFNLFRSNIYRFYAERLNVGICSFGHSSSLHPNASNLAEVLNYLQSGNSARFERFNKYVSVIFPQIKRISIEPRPDNRLEIMVWNLDPKEERQDLAVNLSSCGTGIGQVLAILYVVMNSTEPKTIIIDEPQSFLHPGAAKKLIEILKEFPQHQYFISTHSPTIINVANPDKIVMLKYDNCQTQASVMNADSITEQRAFLDELGVSLSDVFGADNILWVEGPTEKKSFPIIISKILKKSLRGTNILPVSSPGDFDIKQVDLIFNIYDKLSDGASLFPPAIGFIFDSELRPDTKRQDLQRRSRNKLKFLPRRLYENYLLNSKAIAAVINKHYQNDGEPVNKLDIENWLNEKMQEKSYLPKGTKIEELSKNDWLRLVDGAKLLKDLFIHFCRDKLSFSKTTHSVELTQWIAENCPEELFELADLLEKILYPDSGQN